LVSAVRGGLRNDSNRTGYSGAVLLGA